MAIDDSDYHGDFSTVSKTMLNLFCDSPQEYYRTYVTREMPTKQPTTRMLAGQVLHAAILEGLALDDLVQCYPASCLKSDGSLNGKPAAQFRDDNPGIACLKDREYESIAAVYAAVMGHTELSRIVEYASALEQRHDATIEGVACRCKPDIACDLGDRVIAYDLKFTEKPDPRSFRSISKRFRYWLQDAHYSAVLAEHYGKPVQFRFCCVEVTFPFRIQWYWYDIPSRETARAEHRRKLRELHQRTGTGNWLDDWESVVVLEPWDVSSDELMEVE